MGFSRDATDSGNHDIRTVILVKEKEEPQYVAPAQKKIIMDDVEILALGCLPTPRLDITLVVLKNPSDPSGPLQLNVPSRVGKIRISSKVWNPDERTGNARRRKRRMVSYLCLLC